MNIILIWVNQIHVDRWGSWWTFWKYADGWNNRHEMRVDQVTELSETMFDNV